MDKPMYIDPTTDFGFKRIFGIDSNKDLLIAFLNDLFRGKKSIVDLYYNKHEDLEDTRESGEVIIELNCTTQSGEQVIIQLQRSPRVNLKKRILYHASKLICDQVSKGPHQDWNLLSSEVYVIVLMDGFRMSGVDSNKFLHDICLANRETGDVFDQSLSFMFLELVNFHKSQTQLDNDLDHWLYVLKNMSSMQKLPNDLQKPIFKKLFQIAQYAKLNKQEKEEYSLSLKRKQAEQVTYKFHEKELLSAQGKAAEKARLKEKRDIVRKLIEEPSLSDDAIMRIAGVSSDYLNKLVSQMDDASLKRMWDAQALARYNEEYLSNARRAIEKARIKEQEIQSKTRQ